MWFHKFDPRLLLSDSHKITEQPLIAVPKETYLALDGTLWNNYVDSELAPSTVLKSNHCRSAVLPRRRYQSLRSSRVLGVPGVLNPPRVALNIPISNGLRDLLSKIVSLGRTRKAEFDVMIIRLQSSN